MVVMAVPEAVHGAIFEVLVKGEKNRKEGKWEREDGASKESL